MKIYIVHEYGAGSHVAGLQHYANKNGYAFSYIEFRFLRQFILSVKQWNIFLLKKSILNMFWFISVLFKPLLNKNRDNIYVVAAAPMDWRFPILCKILSYSGLVYYHTSWPLFKERRFAKSDPFGVISAAWKNVMYKYVKGVFCVTEYSKKSFLGFFSDFDESLVSVVYHSLIGITVVERKSKTYRKCAVFIGRLEADKGIEKLFELARKDREYVIHIVGDGKLRKNILDNPMKNIVLHGKVLDRNVLKDILDQCTFILQPSYSRSTWVEAFGMSLIEGMARGLIPLVTPQLGPKEILSSGGGYIIPYEQYAETCVAIANELTESEIESLSAVCIKKAKQYQIDNISKLWGRLLDNV